MKVVHISYSDAGGAGIAVSRIHSALLKRGIESWILVANKQSRDNTVVVAKESPELIYSPSKNRLLRKFMKMMRSLGFFLNERERYERRINRIPSDHQTFFTSPFSRFDLAHHPLVIDADIVHLHWIANFVDFPSFFPNIDKPIVWTLHDENMSFGGFHYGRDRELFYQYYSTIEDAFCEIKRSSLERCKRIHVVSLSRMMRDFYSSHSFLANRDISIIHNGIDSSTFRVFDRALGRQVYGIPENNLVVVFCCLFLNDKRKGLSELVRAIERLNRKDITLLCIGKGRFEGKTSIDIQYTGPITDGDRMALTYSCGDLYAFPSYQEAFAQSPLEAISCGLPIVAFPCSGMEELINEKNGVMCSGFTEEALFEGLKSVLGRSYDRQQLHDDISNRFSIEAIASEYFHLYNSLLTS